jgi:hypothetical protein
MRIAGCSAASVDTVHRGAALAERVLTGSMSAGVSLLVA